MKLKLTIALLVSCLLASPSLLSQSRQDRGQGVRIKVENGQEIELYAESHALIIGVSDYANGWPKLPGVKGDVNEVSAVLREHGFTITTAIDPMRVQLDQAVRRFITKYGQGKQNRLLIYFAGHGHTIEGVGGQQGYIVPADAPDPTRNESAFKDAAISMDEIESYIRRIEAKHALWVFDSCFSGALFEVTRAAPSAITTRTARPVRQFITAGTAEQRVPDESVFRAQFVEGLRGEADRDKDGYVTGEELGLFLNTTVANYSRGAQTPQHGKIRNPLLDKGDFVFSLPKRTSPPAAYPAFSPSKFYFEYGGEPEPGRRKWRQLNPTIWIEQYPSGHETVFTVIGRATIKGNRGFVVRKVAGDLEKTLVSDNTFEVFIPDRDAEELWAMFRHYINGEWLEWQNLAEITYLQ